jgi:outer membrane lipoprotein-sorting protein
VPTEIRQTINFGSITVDQPIPEGTFTFTPPPGATETDLSSFIPKTLPAK